MDATRRYIAVKNAVLLIGLFTNHIVGSCKKGEKKLTKSDAEITTGSKKLDKRIRRKRKGTATSKAGESMTTPVAAPATGTYSNNVVILLRIDHNNNNKTLETMTARQNINMGSVAGNSYDTTKLRKTVPIALLGVDLRSSIYNGE